LTMDLGTESTPPYLTFVSGFGNAPLRWYRPPSFLRGLRAAVTARGSDANALPDSGVCPSARVGSRGEGPAATGPRASEPPGRNGPIPAHRLLDDRSRLGR